jgi:hypothetical protein
MKPMVLVACLWFIVSSVTAGISADRCGPDLAERVTVPNSGWIVLTEAFRCSAIDPGELQVIAEDVETRQRVNILILNGISDTHVEYLDDHRVQVSLPNLVAIKLQRFSFGRYHVTYRYLPSDDPDMRTNFQRWITNPRDPIANKWYEDNIRNKIQSGVPRAPK